MEGIDYHVVDEPLREATIVLHQHCYMLNKMMM